MKTIHRHIVGIGLLSWVFFSCAPGGNSTIAEGNFEASEVIVSAEASGRILSLDLEEGDRVLSGVPFGKIDDLQLTLKRAQLAASRGSVESRRPDIGVQVAAIRQQIATAHSERVRVENLVKANAAFPKQLDDADAQIATLERQLAAQIQSLEKSSRGVTDESSSISLQIAQLDDQIARCSLSSPVDGTVLALYARLGEFAVTGKPLFKVANLSRMYLRVYITATDLSQLRIGDVVRVLADSGEKGSRTYTGTVSWISDKAEFTPKTIQTRDERANLVYAMKVAVVNDGYLKIGMYGSIERSK